MNILYQGTGAAEGIPAYFCFCETCKKARAAGGKEIRTRAGSLIDGVLKLDFGPDSYTQMLAAGEDYRFLHSVLITHSHEDHLNPADVVLRRPGFAAVPENEPVLTVYGNSAVGRLIHVNDRVKYSYIEPFVPTDIEGYTVTALKAVHCLTNEKTEYPVRYDGETLYRAEDCHIYLIEKDGKSILYAHDTDLLAEENMEYLTANHKHLDLVSLDCTSGSWITKWKGHMTAAKNLIVRERLLAAGLADESTKFVANHFSHNGYTDYEDMQKRLPGFILAVDGMKIEV